MNARTHLAAHFFGVVHSIDCGQCAIIWLDGLFGPGRHHFDHECVVAFCAEPIAS